MTTTIQTELRDGVGVVTLNRPPLNILSRSVLETLRTELASLAVEREIRVLLLNAMGKHFSAGADVGEHLPPEFATMIPEFLDTVRAILEFPLPVIAVVHGKCLGGGFELVQAADFVLAARGAVFGQPEIVLGVLPPAACVLLPERCTRSAAADLVLTGDPMDAESAFRVGLVHRVYPDEALAEGAQEFAERMARHSAAALRLGKTALLTPGARARSDAFARAHDLYVNELMETDDAVEGLQAFMEKRKPAWRHQ